MKMGFVPIMLLCLCSWKAVFGNTLARTSENITSCAGVKPILEMKNVSANIPDVPVSGDGLQVCESGMSCCTREMEDNLRLLVRKDFQGFLHHNSRSLEGVMASTASKIQEHVSMLTRQSENRTLALFGQVYQHMAVLAREPINALYSDIVSFLSSASSNLQGSELSLEDSMSTFFSRLFPLVYHHAVTPRLRDFSDDYKSCLRATMPELQPFGDIPRQLGQAVAKTMEATRVLLQALALGAEVLNSTDALPMAEECHVALLRMSYCARCQGLPAAVRPCVGYCLNVLRGCLTQNAAELDLPWNGFVESTERLAKAVKDRDVEHVLRSLHTRITEAIMHAEENCAQLEKRTKHACGPSRWKDAAAGEVVATGEVLPPSVTLAPEGAGGGASALLTQLGLLLTSLGRSRGFYANLAESLCSDDSFAETRDTADCWNGQRMGEYSKMVVASSLSAQKYNPELVWAQRNPDPKIAQLSDKLRHIRQVVLSQLTLAPESDSFVHDIEGSGSGQQAVKQWHGDDEDGASEWSDQGSGSGDPPNPDLSGQQENNIITSHNPGKSKDSSGMRSAITSSWLLALLVVVSMRVVPALRNG